MTNLRAAQTSMGKVLVHDAAALTLFIWQHSDLRARLASTGAVSMAGFDIIGEITHS